MKINIVYPKWMAFMTGYNEVLCEEIAAAISQTSNECIVTEEIPVKNAGLYIIVAQYREEARSEWMSNLCKHIKEINNGLIGVCGKATTESRRFLLQYMEEIDFVIKGEVENVLYSLLKLNDIKMEWQKVKGITYRKNNTVIENADMECIKNYDELPMAEYSYLENKEKYPIAVMISSRGCHGNCKFCEGNICRMHNPGPIYRAKSARRVVDEMEYIYNRYKRRIFSFADDNFMVDGELGKKRAYEIAKMLIDREINVRYTIECRADDIDLELFRLLKKSGLYKVFVGLESGSQAMLDRLGKGTTVNDNIKAIETLSLLKIKCEPGYIFFDAATTLEELKDSLVFFRSMTSRLYSINDGNGTCRLYYPYETSLYKELWENRNETFFGRIASESIDYPFLHKETKMIYELYAQKVVQRKPVDRNMLEWRISKLEEAIKEYEVQ